MSEISEVAEVSTGRNMDFWDFLSYYGSVETLDTSDKFLCPKFPRCPKFWPGHNFTTGSSCLKSHNLISEWDWRRDLWNWLRQLYEDPLPPPSPENRTDIKNTVRHF